MTEFEIVKSFNEAKKPAAQITVLSELNCVSEEHIKNILLKNGVDHRRLPREKRKKCDSPTPPLKTESREREREAEGPAQPATDILEEKIVQLIAERDVIQKKIDALYLAQEILSE